MARSANFIIILAVVSVSRSANISDKAIFCTPLPAAPVGNYSLCPLLTPLMLSANSDLNNQPRPYSLIIAFNRNANNGADICAIVSGGDLTWGGCRSSSCSPSVPSPLSLLPRPCLTHSLPYSSFLLPLNLARRSGLLSTLTREKMIARCKVWTGPNRLGPRDLQSWRGRVPRVPWGGCTLPDSGTSRCPGGGRAGANVRDAVEVTPGGRSCEKKREVLSRVRRRAATDRALPTNRRTDRGNAGVSRTDGRTDARTSWCRQQ